MNLKLTLIIVLLSLTQFHQNNNKQSLTNTGGVYSKPGEGEITVALNNGILTGVYEYYDKWDEQYHEYRDINLFYFYGTSSDGITYKINAKETAHSETIAGTVAFTDNRKKLKIILSEQPNGYASFDFTASTDKNVFVMDKSNKATGIRFVKAPKAALFTYDGKLFVKRKAYLVKENPVAILSTVNGYAQISYRSPGGG